MKNYSRKKSTPNKTSYRTPSRLLAKNAYQRPIKPMRGKR